jgi:hypothetical protein
MAYNATSEIVFYLDLLNEAEDDAAKATVAAFATGQGGQYTWVSKQNKEGAINSVGRVFLDVADRVEANSKFTAVENNLELLPRSGTCVRSLKLLFCQEGLPDQD